MLAHVSRWLVCLFLSPFSSQESEFEFGPHEDPWFYQYLPAGSPFYIFRLNPNTSLFMDGAEEVATHNEGTQIEGWRPFLNVRCAAGEVWPRSPLWPCMVLCGLRWSYVVLCGLRWSCVVLRGLRWSCVVLRGLRWSCVVLRGLRWSSLAWLVFCLLSRLKRWKLLSRCFTVFSRQINKRGTGAQSQSIYNLRCCGEPYVYV